MSKVTHETLVSTEFHSVHLLPNCYLVYYSILWLRMHLHNTYTSLQPHCFFIYLSIVSHLSIYLSLFFSSYMICENYIIQDTSLELIFLSFLLTHDIYYFTYCSHTFLSFVFISLGVKSTIEWRCLQFFILHYMFFNLSLPSTFYTSKMGCTLIILQNQKT